MHSLIGNVVHAKIYSVLQQLVLISIPNNSLLAAHPAKSAAVLPKFVNNKNNINQKVILTPDTIYYLRYPQLLTLWVMHVGESAR